MLTNDLKVIFIYVYNVLNTISIYKESEKHNAGVMVTSMALNQVAEVLNPKWDTGLFLVADTKLGGGGAMQRANNKI